MTCGPGGWLRGVAEEDAAYEPPAAPSDDHPCCASHACCPANPAGSNPDPAYPPHARSYSTRRSSTAPATSPRSCPPSDPAAPAPPPRHAPHPPPPHCPPPPPTPD